MSGSIRLVVTMGLVMAGLKDRGILTPVTSVTGSE